MLAKLDKAYVYFYWRLSLWLRTSLDFWKNYHKWKASLAIGVLEFFVLMMIVNFLTVMISGFSLPRNGVYYLISIMVIVAFFNTYVFDREITNKYISEFSGETKKQHLWKGAAVLSVVFAIISLFIFSFVLLSARSLHVQ